MSTVTTNNNDNKNTTNFMVGKKPNESSFQDLKLEITVLIKLLSASGNDDNENDDLETLAKISRHIDTATGFASIPDILKVLMLFENELKRIYENKRNDCVKKILADIISYTCSGHSSEIKGQIVKYYMLGSKNLISQYGMSYVRNLVKDVVEIWKNSPKDNKQTLLKLIHECSIYFIRQNSEIEACDLLIEVEQLPMLETIIHDEDLCEKVCQYLIVSSLYVDETESQNILYTSLSLYLDHKLYTEALFVAIQMQSKEIIVRIFLLCPDLLIRRQMALILARHNISFTDDDEFSSRLRNSIADDDQPLLDALSNHRLSQEFLLVAKQLDLLQPKAPHDIVHKDLNRRNRKKQPMLPTYNQQSVLGTSFMNCFINAAFGTDKLVLTGTDWIGRHKDLCRMTATATMGLLCLWDMQNGLLKIDRFLRFRDENIKAGALMAFGLINTTIKSDYEPAYLLLKNYIMNRSQSIRIGSIAGLAMAYLGTNHGEVIKSILDPMMANNSSSDRNQQWQHPLELSAIACGLIAHSTGNMLIINRLIEIMDKNIDKMKLADSSTRDLIHAIGLVVMFRRKDLPTLIDLINQRFNTPQREASTTSISTTTSTRSSLGKYLSLCVQICAYIGSSNILKIQYLLRNCSPIITDELTKKKDESNDEKCKKENEKNDKNNRKNDAATITDNELIQMLSIIGIGLVSISDQLNSEMVFQTFIRFLKLGSVRIKSSVLIAIALTNLSDPKMNVIELLHKYCHFTDENVAINAILALGFVCAGTNHSRVSRMLTELDAFNRDKVNRLFAIKVAQGLLYMGKGVLTLSPQMETPQLLRQSSLASIMSFMFRLFVDPVNDLIQRHHYYLLFIAGSIRPKFLVTLDTKMNSIAIPVRVGQSMDTIGVAGWKPRAITAFGTFTTPVLLNRNERAELATDLFRPLSSHLEGFVLVEKKKTNDDHNNDENKH